MDDMQIPRKLLTAKVEGRKPRRPRTEWLEEVNKDTRSMGVTIWWSAELE
jgi:hypothetical protein